MIGLGNIGKALPPTIAIPPRSPGPVLSLAAAAPSTHHESAAVATRDHDRGPDDGPDNLPHLGAHADREPVDDPPLRGRVSRVRDDLLAVELARGQTRAQAAKTLGISERTVYARLALPGFRAKVQAIRRETLLTSLAILNDSTTLAATVLRELLGDSEVEAKVKLGAALGVYKSLVAVAELAEHGDQIRALNDRLDQLQAQQTTGKNRIGRRPHLRVDKLPEP